MGKKSGEKTKWIFSLGIISFLTGCAPPPPLPPIFPGFEWLIIGIVIWIGVFLWKKYSSEKPVQKDYVTDALNAINNQLKILEKRIKKFEEEKYKKEK